ncbi:MAG: hypothetical protein WD045_16590 [Pirellulaceae bacterium]
MQRVKIFKSVESEVEALEEQVNQWLAESGAKVLQMSGNIAPQTSPLAAPPQSGGSEALRFPPSDVMLIVLYEAELS